MGLQPDVKSVSPLRLANLFVHSNNGTKRWRQTAELNYASDTHGNFEAAQVLSSLRAAFDSLQRIRDVIGSLQCDTYRVTFHCQRG